MSKIRRREFMDTVRFPYVDTFREAVLAGKEKRFKKKQCLVYKLAKSAARALGVHSKPTMVDLHNGWRSAEFIHKFTATLPDPPILGQPKEAPVVVTTIFKVIKKSSRVQMKWLRLDEEGKEYDAEESAGYFKRPQPSESSDWSDED